jgi:hypothetical protein
MHAAGKFLHGAAFILSIRYVALCEVSPRFYAGNRRVERIKDRNSKATFARCAVQCTLRDRAVKRPARMPRVPLLRLGGARGALCPRVRPACGCLPGALAVSRASGDVDAMLKSIHVGGSRLPSPGSGSRSRATSTGGSKARYAVTAIIRCVIAPYPGGPRIGAIRGARLSENCALPAGPRQFVSAFSDAARLSGQCGRCFRHRREKLHAARRFM